MNGDVDSGEKRGNHSLGGFQLRCGARHIEFRRQTGFGPDASKIQSLLLRVNVLVGDLQAALEAAQLRIAAADVAEQNHQYVATILLRRYSVRGSRADAVTDSPEHVQLP